MSKKQKKINKFEQKGGKLSLNLQKSYPHIDILKSYIKRFFNDKFKLNILSSDISITYPQNEKFGDYSTSMALKMAKTCKKQPYEIAEMLAKYIEKCKIVKNAEAVSGFVNIRLNNDFFFKQIIEILEKKENYAKQTFGKGKKLLIEHTSPNPNKAMHLGHLRNNVTGMAFANICESLGFKVIRDCIDNNRGIAIAKLMWGYLKFGKKDGKHVTDLNYWFDHQDEWVQMKDLKIRPDKFVDELYVKATDDYKESEDAQKKIKQLVIDWEAENKKNWALWAKVLDFSYRGQNETYKRLKSKHDHVWHEHEHYKMGKDLVAKGLKEGIFKKSKGAIVTNLKKYKIPDTVVIKSDGTALYITQDIALTKLKIEKFNPDRIFWVVGPEQKLALMQVFAVCDQLKIGKYESFTHIPFGFMSIKGSGKMSSRAGNVVYIDDLIDKAKEIIKEKMKDRNFSKEEMEEISEKLAVGSVKYSILRLSRNTDTAFSFEESLSFDGDSLPYLSYTYSRANSILKRVQISQKAKSLTKNDLSDDDVQILRQIFKFRETVFDAGNEIEPSILCRFLFNLSQKFNLYYKRNQIIKCKDEIKKEIRLMITSAVMTIIKSGLELLGIETVEKM